MALLITGKSLCALCGEVIAKGDRAVGTSHFIGNPADPFFRYSDAPFHERCFDAWDKREEFLARYEEAKKRVRGTT